MERRDSDPDSHYLPNEDWERVLRERARLLEETEEIEAGDNEGEAR